VAGFEPATPSSRTRCATRFSELSYCATTQIDVATYMQSTSNAALQAPDNNLKS
jgi:hypothetical protein